MNDLFTMDEFMMMGLVLFSSFWIFLFNYRTDNKEYYDKVMTILNIAELEQKLDNTLVIV